MSDDLPEAWSDEPMAARGFDEETGQWSTYYRACGSGSAEAHTGDVFSTTSAWQI